MSSPQILIDFVYPYTFTTPDVCTGSALIVKGLAEEVGTIPEKGLVLYHEAEDVLTVDDRRLFQEEELPIILLDSPWQNVRVEMEKASSVLIRRRLPSVFHATNPFYTKKNPLLYFSDNQFGTAEALAIALFILGYRAHAMQVLNILSYKDEFLQVNGEALSLYNSVP
ncbi:DUF367 domain-containing protein [Nostoc sp. NIES-2111]